MSLDALTEVQEEHSDFEETEPPPRNATFPALDPRERAQTAFSPDEPQTDQYSEDRTDEEDRASTIATKVLADIRRKNSTRAERLKRKKMRRISTLPTMSGTRRPYHYTPGDPGNREVLASRYRYYSRLDPRSGSLLQIPDHVIPSSFFTVVPMEQGQKQHSIVTIFSIWNTMVGTALLTMPWALHKAGLILGLILMISMATLAFYTAYRVVQSPRGLQLGVQFAEFSDVCKYFWGKPGEYAGVGFSMVVLLGAAIVYWVLMSNFLFNTGMVIYESVLPNSTEIILFKNDTLHCDVSCINKTNKITLESREDTPLFEKAWRLQLTVPFYLALLAFPILNFESPTFFTKFNGLGTVSVVYLFVFVCIKASECGFHLDFTATRESLQYVPLANWSFPALTGTLGLSYFIHNCILTILRSQKTPQNNVMI